MKSRVKHIIRKYFEPQAMVLMYHRIAEAEADIWDIAVSPVNFEAQLQVLKKWGTVIPLHELVERKKENKLKNNSIAITFDDGYVDNFLTAKPLLEYYQLPATFFISSGNIQEQKEFWWDELEHIILFSEELPDSFSATIHHNKLDFKLEEESYLSPALRQVHCNWKACETEAPGRRAAMFLALWAALKVLPHQEQQAHLSDIFEWAGLPRVVRPDYSSMSLEQLRELADSKLISIGTHTVRHPALAYHGKAYQEKEIMENKNFLEQAIGKEVKLLAYPYGNYNQDSLAVAERAGFTAAFSTEEKVVDSYCQPYCLGRFQVKNFGGYEFNSRLKYWKTKI